MATSGDRYLATSGDFFMATDTITHLREASFPEVEKPTWQPSWPGSPDSSIG